MESPKSKVKLKAYCGCNALHTSEDANPYSVIMLGESHALEHNHTVQFVGECRVTKRPKVQKERSRDYKRQPNINFSNL